MDADFTYSQMTAYGPDDIFVLRSAIFQDGFAICRGAVNAAEVGKIQKF